jgi:predicted  nucleic acid-binding Zn-ribbon protein
MPEDPNEARMSALEARITDLQEQLSNTKQQLTDAQLDQWKGRIDEIEVQMSLGRMEAQEQLEPMIEQLRNRWLDAQTQLRTAGSAASDVFAALRVGLEQAMDQLREGARMARNRINE